MSKKRTTQNQQNADETKTALQAALDQANEATEETINSETNPEPTREERLADFKVTYAKLITATYDDIRLAYEPIALAIEKGRVAEHPDVTTAKAQIAALEAQKSTLDTLPENIRKYAEIGMNAEIAKSQALIEAHKDEDPIANLLISSFWFELYDAGLIKFGKTSKKRAGGKRSNNIASFDHDCLVAFSYQTKRTLADGTALEVSLTQGYIVGPENKRITDAGLFVPNDKLAILTAEGLLMGKVAITESKGSILGTAVAVVAGLSEDYVGKISSTGIAALDQSKRDNKHLLQHVPTFKASLLTNGKNSELANQTVGSRELAEKS
jgi:hypothetical protein